MFNIENSIRILRAADFINTSRNLTDEDKIALLKALAAGIMTEMPGCPDHCLIVHASLDRMTRNERSNIAKKQGRKAEGVQDPAPVATGRAEEGSTTSEGTTEGVQEPAEDAGRADTAEPVAAAPKPRKAK